MKIQNTLFVLSLLLAGCETPKSFVATNGSRADGVIELSYTHGDFEDPVVDKQETYNTAKKRCLAWGYADTEPFGAEISTCNDVTCDETLVTTRYQCLGDLK